MVKYQKRFVFQYYNFIGIICFCLFFIGCNVAVKSSKEGYLTKLFFIQYLGSDEQLLTPDYSYPQKVWYKDEFSIEPVPIIRIRDSANVSLWKAEELYYTFVDLAYRNYFRYASFSDTAKMLQCCYTTTDSLGIAYGWNFFYCKGSTQKTTPVFLKDTSLDGVLYKRAVFYKEDSTGQKKPRSIYYFNLERNDTTFTLSHSLTHT